MIGWKCDTSHKFEGNVLATLSSDVWLDAVFLPFNGCFLIFISQSENTSKFFFYCVKPNVIVFFQENQNFQQSELFWFFPPEEFKFFMWRTRWKKCFSRREFSVFSLQPKLSLPHKRIVSFLPYHFERYQHRFATIIFPSFPNFCEEKFREKHFYFLFLSVLSRQNFFHSHTWRKNYFFCMLSQMEK